MVWQPLKISLHYLQIDALRKRVASAVLAETRCGRTPDGQSGALACARIANELLNEANAHRVRVSVNRVCSRVIHVIHDVPSSDRVVELGYDWGTDVHRPARTSPLLYFFSQDPFGFIRVGHHPLPHTSIRAERMPWMGQSILRSRLERKCGPTVRLQMGNTS